MSRTAAGFTLIEVLLATALLAAGLSLAFVTVRSAIDGRVVNAGARLYRRFNDRRIGRYRRRDDRRNGCHRRRNRRTVAATAAATGSQQGCQQESRHRSGHRNMFHVHL